MCLAWGLVVFVLVVFPLLVLPAQVFTKECVVTCVMVVYVDVVPNVVYCVALCKKPQCILQFLLGRHVSLFLQIFLVLVNHVAYRRNGGSCHGHHPSSVGFSQYAVALGQFLSEVVHALLQTRT